MSEDPGGVVWLGSGSLWKGLLASSLMFSINSVIFGNEQLILIKKMGCLGGAEV